MALYPIQHRYIRTPFLDNIYVEFLFCVLRVYFHSSKALYILLMDMLPFNNTQINEPLAPLSIFLSETEDNG